MADHIQKACEIVEELVEREAKTNTLSNSDFFALNTLLLEMTIAGKYVVPEKYMEDVL